jgi:hypothetical protein
MKTLIPRKTLKRFQLFFAGAASLTLTQVHADAVNSVDHQP